MPLDDVALIGDESQWDMIVLSDALDALGREDPEAVRIVEMRYFAGMEVGQIAAVLGVTERTVHRRWTFARVWLYRALREPGGDGDGKETS